MKAAVFGSFDLPEKIPTCGLVVDHLPSDCFGWTADGLSWPHQSRAFFSSRLAPPISFCVDRADLANATSCGARRGSVARGPLGRQAAAFLRTVADSPRDVIDVLSSSVPGLTRLSGPSGVWLPEQEVPVRLPDNARAALLERAAEADDAVLAMRKQLEVAMQKEEEAGLAEKILIFFTTPLGIIVAIFTGVVGVGALGGRAAYVKDQERKARKTTESENESGTSEAHTPMSDVDPDDSE